MKFTKILATIIAFSMIMSGLAFLTVGSDTEDIQVDSPPEEPVVQQGGSSPRTILVECLTSAWCTFCPPQLHTNDRIVEEIGTDNLVMIEYHQPGSDPFGSHSPEPWQRAGWYNYGFSIPDTIYNGGGPYIDSRNWIGSCSSPPKYGGYDDDMAVINADLAYGAPCTINIEGDINSGNGDVHIDLDFTDVPSEDNLVLTAMLYESNMYHYNSSHPGYCSEVTGHHREFNNIARAVLYNISIPNGVGPSDHFEYDFSFTPINWYPENDKRRLGIVAFVQSMNLYYNVTMEENNFPVLQAASYEFEHPNILLVNDDSTDWLDNGLDHLGEELRKVKRSIHIWDTQEVGDTETRNMRTMPTSSDLIDHYGLVIWYTGVDTNTLDATDRATIEAYLNSGGNVFLTGSNIAQNANSGGWNSWLQTNFGATYGSSNTGATAINGVASDVIGDGIIWQNIETNSPDEINPVGSGVVSFTYNNTGENAAIRAPHSGGGRTMFIACNYYLGQDTVGNETDEEEVLNRTLDWLDQAAEPKVFVNYPDGGETFAQGEEVTITWEAIDVDVLEDGIDVYYCTDYPIATWIPISSGETSDSIQKWTTPVVDSNTCRIRIVARDGMGNSGEDLSALDFSIGAPVTIPFDIPVAPSPTGWEFISFPIGVGGNVETILDDSINGDGQTQWDLVQWYDAQNQNWRSYASYKPASLNNMPNMDNTMGVWVHITANGGDDEITTGAGGDYSGSPVNVDLFTGWNLVGYPSATSRKATDTLPPEADMIGIFDSGEPYSVLDVTSLNGPDSWMSEGDAYWVRVTADCTWQVDP